MSLKCLFGHQWNGCKCVKCGTIRDEGHNWEGCKCSLCGKVRDEQHIWGRYRGYTDDCKCTRCYKRITIQDINKITNQSVLGIIAEFASGNFSNVCNVALEKLTDQKILAGLAKNSYCLDSQSVEALQKLTDQALLIDISKFARSEIVRARAAEKLTDKKPAQEIFIEIAKNSKDKYARRDAVENIIDQAILAEIANNDEDIHVRIIAAAKLPNQKELAEIAKNNAYIDVRGEVIEKLTDQETLAYIAMNKTYIKSGGIYGDTYRNIRAMAIKKITNKEILTEIVNSGAEKYLYTWEESYYTSSNDSDYKVKNMSFDLRDIARERLTELNKMK